MTPRPPYRLAAATLLLAALACLLFAGRADAQLIPNLGGQRAGISAFQFLKIDATSRGVGMGGAFVAVANDVSSLYWNPAGLAQMDMNQVMVTHTNYVVDIQHEFLAASYRLSSYDAVGFSVTSLHMDDMQVTTETQPFGTGEYFSFGDIAFGATYSRKMTDQFSFGVTVRYVEETLDVLKMRGLMADIGTFYWTGLGTSRFSVVVSNFGGDVTPSGTVTQFSGQTVSNFQSFSPPTRFKIGFAIEPFEMTEQRLTTSLELNHPNDNAENVHLGAEYAYQERLFLRAGVKRTIGESLFGNDQTGASDFAMGMGVLMPVGSNRISVDYAFVNNNGLGSVHMFSVGVTY
jgi:long-subunit fatty acid transport protein